MHCTFETHIFHKIFYKTQSQFVVAREEEQRTKFTPASAYRGTQPDIEIRYKR